MAFTNIDATKPTGSEKISTADNYIRELKTDIETNLSEISGYPNNSAVKEAIWTTSTRPTTNLVAGLSGFNTTLGYREHYSGSAWIPCYPETNLKAQITSGLAFCLNYVTSSQYSHPYMMKSAKTITYANVYMSSNSGTVYIQKNGVTINSFSVYSGWTAFDMDNTSVAAGDIIQALINVGSAVVNTITIEITMEAV